jgi:hypothetical protein
MSETGEAKARRARRLAIAHAADTPTDQMRIRSKEAA